MPLTTEVRQRWKEISARQAAVEASIGRLGARLDETQAAATAAAAAHGGTVAPGGTQWDARSPFCS